MLSRHLLLQSQQWKHSKKVQNLTKSERRQWHRIGVLIVTPRKHVTLSSSVSIPNILENIGLNMPFSSRHLPAIFLCYNRNTWTRCKSCSKLTTKTRQLQQFWCYQQFFHVGVFCTSYVRPNLRAVSRGTYVTTCLNNPSPTPNKHAKILWKKVWLFLAESYLL